MTTLAVCSFIPCGDPVTAVALGLCIGHYKQHRSGRALRTKSTTIAAQLIECAYGPCRRTSEVRYVDLCSPHGRQRDKGCPLYAIRGDRCDHCEFGVAQKFGACPDDVARARLGEIVIPGIEVNKTCASKSCERIVTAESTFCPSHTMRKVRGLDVDAPLSLRLEMADRPCEAPHCDLNAETRTGPLPYCSKHSASFRRGGNFVITRSPNGSALGMTCFVTGCSSKQFSTGMCAKHKTRCSTYNLSVMQFDMLIANGSCGICGSTDRLHVDHDHSCCPTSQSCGKCVRGMLCRACNHGLGNFKDSIEALENAIAYLEAA